MRSADGTETELRRQSVDVLRVLLLRRGEIVTKDEIMAAVWGDIAVTDDSLVQCIADLRRALGEPDRALLRTVARRGYLLERDAGAAVAVSARPAFARLALAAAMALLAVMGWTMLAREKIPKAGPPAALAFEAEGPVVAVMPFEAAGGGERWERFAKGVTEEVIADLAANSWIFVLADATTRSHAGDAPRVVRAKLGATYVVGGSVQAEGDRVSVFASLADATTGRQVWSRRWAGQPDDLLAIQTAAAEALVGELAGRYSGAIVRADRARAHQRKTESLEAYELYLLGIEHKHLGTSADLELAWDYLTRATAIDPNFVDAWAALALLEGIRGSFATGDTEFQASESRRRAYLARAVALDPEDAITLIELGMERASQGDLAGAERAIRRAIESASNDADILAVASWAGPYSAPVGRDALAWATRAETLNPRRPGWYAFGKGIAAFSVGDYALASAALRESPPDGGADRWLFLAAAEAMRGDTGAAEAAAGELRRRLPDFDLDWYLDGWPSEPGLWKRLNDGARLAGLGEQTKSAAN